MTRVFLGAYILVKGHYGHDGDRAGMAAITVIFIKGNRERPIGLTFVDDYLLP